MRTQAVFVCAALVVLACAYLPLGGAVTCEEDPNDANCIDCTVATTDPECVTTEAPTEAPTEAGEETTAAGEEPATTVPTDGTETTTAASGGGKKKIIRKRKFGVTIKPGKKTIKRHRKGGKGRLSNKSGNSGGNSRSGRRGGRRSGRRAALRNLGLF